jgi:uncharacterized protein YjbI with pentapeptide repeats
MGAIAKDEACEGEDAVADFEFLGKWALTQNGQYIRIDMSNGVLSVGGQPTDGSGNFNAYQIGFNFILQGNNGKYVVASGGGYGATADRVATVNQFLLQTAGDGTVRVLDLGAGGTGSPQYYWNNQSGILGRVDVSASPPATTMLIQTVMTVGLESILSSGFQVAQPDVTWVDFSGVDFTLATGILDFTQMTMPHVNFAKAVFPGNLGFDGSTGPSANFSGATLSGCSIGRCILTGADFTNARLDDTTLNDSDFSNADFTGANLNGCLNVQGAKFVGAILRNADFRNNGNVIETDFTNADLRGTRFTGSSVTGALILNGANLTGAALNNPPNMPTIYPGNIKLNSQTNFTNANLQYLNFDGYDLSAIIFTGTDLTGGSFKGARLLNTDLSYATLDNTVFTGTVILNGANLANASLKGADLTNAQLGSLSQLFAVGKEDPDYKTFLQGLQQGKVDDVKKVFSDKGHPLAGVVTITQSAFSNTNWTVEATNSTPGTYSVSLETIAGVDTLDVYTPTTPAVLSNAFLVNVNFTNANLIGVNASGCAAYSIGGKTPTLNSALLQRAQFSSANLSNVDFSSANLAGVSFDYAILTGAKFANAHLITDAIGGRATFNGTNLQGVDFDGATISAVSFNNAALATAKPGSSSSSAGVWLFSLTSDEAQLIIPELTAVATPNPSSGPQHQFGLSAQSLQQLQKPGPVGAGISSQFAAAGITLTSGAILSIFGQSVYWQLTDGTKKYVIFQTIDTDYTPSLGVALGSDYTLQAQFYLPLSLQGELHTGRVAPAVVVAFAAAGHPISDTSMVTIAQHPTDWQISNGEPGYEVYSLWLDVSNTAKPIIVRPAIPSVVSAFTNVSIPLSNRATVNTLSTGGWTVNNDAENVFTAVLGYIIFNLIPDSATGELAVYGSLMRIRRLSAPGAYEYANIPAAITRLTQVQMSAASNVCPNGEFATTNQTNKLPYDQWLRARVPPRAPLCIPDPAGLFFCPV